MYIVKDKREQSLLGVNDAVRLGIVNINLKGSSEEMISCITPVVKQDKQDVSMIDEKQIYLDLPNLFSNKTGKCNVGGPIPIQLKDPDQIQTNVPRYRRVPLHYAAKFDKEVERLRQEDIVEGPLEVEEPGTFISNVVLTDKKDSEEVRITLDCADVNKIVYQTHEPMPTIDELRHEFKGSSCFTKLDMTNCYHQFEISEEARKLYTFRTPKGLFRFKRMVPGTSPASSEIQKRVRELVKDCPNTRSIKDDIIIYSKPENHDEIVRFTLAKLEEAGITLRPLKCKIGRPQVKWFGFIISEDGISPDTEHCASKKQRTTPRK